MLWDNYQGVDGYDGVSAHTTERNTLVTESWTVDDAVFATTVIVQQIQWIGERTAGTTFTAADFIILDENFNVVREEWNVPFTDTSLAEVVSSIGTLEVYEGSVDIPNVELPAGHYYLGTRLVGSYYGQNFVATTGNGNFLGLTVGAFQSDFFGVHDWVLVDQLSSTTTVSDYAYRIQGIVVPEPATIATLLIGGLMLAWRRRRLA
jgi:hypothetical protein